MIDIEFVPLPDKQARADEIVEAWDRWQAERKAGMPDRSDAADTRWEPAHRAEGLPVELRAQTEAGLRAKIDLLRYHHGRDLDDEGSDPLAMSIVRDLAAMLDKAA